MRKYGRPLRRIRAAAWTSGAFRAHHEVLGGGEEGKVSLTTKGILLVAKHTWTGRVRVCRLIPADLWWAMSTTQRRQIVASAFKRPGEGMPKDGDAPAPVADKDFAREAQTVLDYMTQPAWPDGSKREKSSMIVFSEDGVFKVCLSDKETGYVLWASASTFWGLLEALEGRLTEGSPDWRKSRAGKKRS